MKSKLCVMILTGLFILSGIAFAEGISDQSNVEQEVKISDSAANPASSEAPAAKEAVPEAADETVKAAAEVPADCSKVALPEKQAEAYSTEK